MLTFRGMTGQMPERRRPVDTWKYYDITHREHILCNPMSSEKLDQLIDLLRLQPEARVLDIASGKAELLIRLAERYGCEGIGVDLSPFYVVDARHKIKTRIPSARLSLFEMNGADYQPDRLESFDLAACLGASWIFNGHRGTLAALNRMAAPMSWIVVGEPYWLREPPAEYLAAAGLERAMFGSHLDNARTGQELGLELGYTLVSSLDDWDRYEGLQWYAAEQWAAAHPDDPDVTELLERIRHDRTVYLTWGRDVLGWAIYVFKKGAFKS